MGFMGGGSNGDAKNPYDYSEAVHLHLSTRLLTLRTYGPVSKT